MVDFKKLLKKKCSECAGPLGENFGFKKDSKFQRFICGECKGEEIRGEMSKAIIINEPLPEKTFPNKRRPTVKEVRQLIDEAMQNFVPHQPDIYEEKDAHAEKKRAIFREGAKLLKEISDECGDKPIGMKFKFLSLNFEKIASECF